MQYFLLFCPLWKVNKVGNNRPFSNDLITHDCLYACRIALLSWIDIITKTFGGQFAKIVLQIIWKIVCTIIGEWTTTTELHVVAQVFNNSLTMNHRGVIVICPDVTHTAVMVKDRLKDRLISFARGQCSAQVHTGSWTRNLKSVRRCKPAARGAWDHSEREIFSRHTRRSLHSF